MEKEIVENMKTDEEIAKTFSEEEINTFLEILSSNESDVKRQEQFNRFIKGELK